MLLWRAKENLYLDCCFYKHGRILFSTRAISGKEYSWLKAKIFCFIKIKVHVFIQVKWSRYRLGVSQRVGRGIALLFHNRGTRRGWVVCRTPRPHFTPGKDPVSILQEAGWAPGPVWTGGKSRPHRDSIPDHPVRSQSLHRLSYRVPKILCTHI